jgi:DNA-directed RNA polymerase specialized sigma24 family protein
MAESESEGSVTHLIALLKGNASPDDVDVATKGLWERYFDQLVRLARAKLSSAPRGPSDEEDLALSAFHTFSLNAAAGRFPRLEDRDDLWKLLMTITARKAINQMRRDHRLKRGGGRVVATATLAEDDGDPLAQFVGPEPTPEVAALVADEVRRLLGLLEDGDQRIIAQMKLECYSNEEIANKLGCALRTVERKLGIVRKVWNEESPLESKTEPSPWTSDPCH